jgi:Putative peptidoglycan binding domain
MAHRITMVVASFFLLLLIAGWLPAQAATSISYSVAGQTYGWCAGYSSSAAPACSTQHCTSSGGTDCQQVLFCPDGWGAVAFPEGSPIGFAADCGLNNRAFAEGRALAACVVASNALCWTDSSFDARGNEQSKDSKSNFDLIWYAQSLLQLNGYTKSLSDGEMGPATHEALSKFQTEIGETPTGVVDDQMVRRLLDADSGMANFARE